MRAGEGHQAAGRNKNSYSEGALNWMDGSTYPCPEELNDTFWRWEFLRRRVDYRQDWASYYPQTYEYNLECARNPGYPTRFNKPVFPPDHPDFISPSHPIGSLSEINPSIITVKGKHPRFGNSGIWQSA